MAHLSSLDNTSLMERHKQLVKKISSEIRKFYDRKEKFRVYHGSTNSTRPRPHNTNTVDTSELSRVLRIDFVKKTAVVEPNVPMDRLVEETMKYGLVPPVVMEFPGITVGGGYAGSSGESSSFKHGYFNETMNSVEMVLANGEVVNCSRTERQDLFFGAAAAVGTLGLTTLCELRLVKATRFVEITCYPVSSMDDAIAVIEREKKVEEVDYIDGIMFSKTHGAIITGRRTNTPKPGTPIQTFSSALDPWFYLHVQSHIGTPSKPITYTEAIPLAEYLFRYDRGGFWVGQLACKYAMVPCIQPVRWFLDDFFHTRMMYTAMHTSNEAQNIIVQDLGLPYENASEFVEYCDSEHGIYPLWLCPLREVEGPTFHSQTPSSHTSRITTTTTTSTPHIPGVLNIGLWGYSRLKPAYSANRSIEHKVVELNGRKMLYAHTYYPRDEFWDIYGGKEWYNELRAKYHAQSLPDVWEKVTVDLKGLEERERELPLWWKVLRWWPLNVFWGLVVAVWEGSYRQARGAGWRSRGLVGRVVGEGEGEGK